jgi:carbon monoxide dehydrogenase subunit G
VRLDGKAKGRWTLTVVPDGEGSRVIWDATVEVGNPGLATMLETGFREAMQSLAAQLQA